MGNESLETSEEWRTLFCLVYGIDRYLQRSFGGTVVTSYRSPGRVQGGGMFKGVDQIWSCRDSCLYITHGVYMKN